MGGKMGGGGLALLLVVFCLCAAGSTAFPYQPLSDADKASVELLFKANDDGSFGSLEDTYNAVRSLQVLNSKDLEVLKEKTCDWTGTVLTSVAYAVRDAYYGLRIAKILKCEQGELWSTNALPNVLSSLKEERSLLDLYFSVGALTSIKDMWGGQSDSYILAVSGVMDIVKELAESHGTWRYDEDSFDSSAKASGIAFEIVAGVIDIAGFDLIKNQIEEIETAAVKLFENSDIDEDGVLYFEESKEDKTTGGVLAVSASILRGVSLLSSVLPDALQIEEDKFIGLANFFLSMGLPNSATEAFYLLDALSILEDNSISVPLVIFLPAAVLSFTSGENLEVAVTKVLGSPAPGVLVTLVSVHNAGKEDSPLLVRQMLHPVEGSNKHGVEFLSKIAEVGKYDLKFKMDPAPGVSHKFSLGGFTMLHVTVTGLVSVSNVELSVVDSDTGSPESLTLLNFKMQDKATLSANHLQKLRLSFELISPYNTVFHPQQVFFKLQHESGVEHLYLVPCVDKVFVLTLDFLGLVEKLYYLSGAYSIELQVGDITMENSFVWVLGSVDLDLPEAPEGAAKPPPAAVDINTKFGAKPEIAHIFRQPERLPATQVSASFFVLTLLPLVGFLIGLWSLGVNVRNFPSAGFQVVAALSFHGVIAAILILYTLFWLKLDLFTTLKALGVLGFVSVIPGYYILSYLADLSPKLKTA